MMSDEKRTASKPSSPRLAAPKNPPFLGPNLTSPISPFKPLKNQPNILCPSNPLSPKNSTIFRNLRKARASLAMARAFFPGGTPFGQRDARIHRRDFPDGEKGPAEIHRGKTLPPPPGEVRNGVPVFDLDAKNHDGQGRQCCSKVGIGNRLITLSDWMRLERREERASMVKSQVCLYFETHGREELIQKLN
nr:hypothetical protein Iba_chr05fCG8840 [Ipomoea batatas]